MERHLEHKVILGTQPEHKNLYSWFLKEVGDKVGKYEGDQIPWPWTLYFAATKIELVTGAETENKRDNNGSKITDIERIAAKLTPGYIKDGHFHPETSYSMFGTNRRIRDFELRIYKTLDNEKEGCSAWGCVSYDSEVDFTTETIPDHISFYLMVNPERFDRYVQKISEKSVTSAQFRVGNVDGFYSDWSPSISTSNIKVLTPDKKDHPVDIPTECEIVPPRLGFVGEAELLLYTTQEFNMPAEDDTDSYLEPSELFEEKTSFFGQDQLNTQSHELKKENLAQIFHSKVSIGLTFISIIPITAFVCIYINSWAADQTHGRIFEVGEWFWFLLSTIFYSSILIWNKTSNKTAKENLFPIVNLASIIFAVWAFCMYFLTYAIVWPVYGLYWLIYFLGYAFREGQLAQSKKGNGV